MQFYIMVNDINIIYYYYNMSSLKNYICINVGHYDESSDSDSDFSEYVNKNMTDKGVMTDKCVIDYDLEKGLDKKVLVRHGFDAYDQVQKSDFLLMFICLTYGILGAISYYIYYATHL